MRFEPTLALTTAPSPSEPGDTTTAPQRFLKKEKFHETVLCLISLNDLSNRIYFWCSLYTRNSNDTEAWKYYYNLRYKQTLTKNSGPGS